VSVDPRGSGGYGHWFEEYIHYHLGALEVSDLTELVTSLRNFHYVDASRIGLWGKGYGGHVAIQAMIGLPELFKVAFADSPIIDWAQNNAYFTERYLGLLPDHSREYDESNEVLERAGKLKRTVALATPRDISPESIQVAELQAALARDGKQSQIVLFPRIGNTDVPTSVAVELQYRTAFFLSQL
jgi:hypothetical protein